MKQIGHVPLIHPGLVVRPDLFHRCSIKLGGIFNDTWLVLGPHFIEDSYIDFICYRTFKQSFMFLVKSLLDICRDQVDDRGESGFGLRGVGCAYIVKPQVGSVDLGQ